MRKISSKLAGQQSGFTLIELVIVIVIIGILAAVAIPNFADVTDSANQSSADGIAANLATAASANAAVCAGSLMSGSTPLCKSGVADCQAALNVLVPGHGATAAAGTPIGGSNTCVVTKNGKPSAAVIVKGV